MVRDEILTEYSFDNKTTAQGIETNRGTNDWSNSYLREFLNDYYYEGKTITCHTDDAPGWPTDVTATNATITCPNVSKINTSSKNMIEQSTWYLGGSTYKINTQPYETYSVNELYVSERETKVYSGHATTSSDYIGLIYPSDYGYASTDESCRQNLRSGLTYENNAYGGSPTCKNNNWLNKSKWYWTISPYSSRSEGIFTVPADGRLSYDLSFSRANVLPSLYLKQDVKVVGGLGTKDNMFKLEI